MSIHPERVLEQFGVVNATLEALGDTDNLNYRVSTQNGKHMLLRTHRSGRHDRDALKSECLWLQHLHQHGLKVQQPMPLPDGGFILESDGTHHSLLTWIEGEVLKELNDAQAEAAGALMARLHLIAQDFTPPPGFTRVRYDAAHWERTLERLQAVDWLQPDHDLLERGMRFAQAAFQDTASFHLIHGDVHAANLVFNNAQVSPIDFDLSGFGPAGFDIATALGFLDSAQKPAFLRGYTSLKPLPESFETQQIMFDIASWLENLAFLAPRPHEREFIESDMLPALRAELPAILENTA